MGVDTPHRHKKVKDNNKLIFTIHNFRIEYLAQGTSFFSLGNHKLLEDGKGKFSFYLSISKASMSCQFYQVMNLNKYFL